VSLRPGARLQGRNLYYEHGGLCFEGVEGDTAVAVRSHLVGEHNASNLLGVLAALRALDIPLADAAAVMAQLDAVPGRLEQVPAQAPGQPVVVVDYAHTPDALEKALRALRPLARARGGRLWCIFGCGGDRDATKRPLMGAIAGRDADHVVLTSDNPRSESPRQILAQILMGVARSDAVDVIEDRAAAIADAVRRADAADVLLLAGKGHERVQEVMGDRRPFSDLEEARACLARLAEGVPSC
jgi:MurE/MurF fusion protein